MTGIETARETFSHAGLAFPVLPERLGEMLEEKEPWIFSTRDVPAYPYFLDRYQDELSRPDLEDYVILAHGGHSLNSYAIQYYIVYGIVRVLLHHGWGGAFMDHEETTIRTNRCIQLVDRIVEIADSRSWSAAPEPLTVVASDFYGSSWVFPDGETNDPEDRSVEPGTALSKAVRWLEERSL